MRPIDVLEIFEFLLQKDAESFRADEISKQKNWSFINRKFLEKETDSSKQEMEKNVINKVIEKGKRE